MATRTTPRRRLARAAKTRSGYASDSFQQADTHYTYSAQTPPQESSLDTKTLSSEGSVPSVTDEDDHSGQRRGLECCLETCDLYDDKRGGHDRVQTGRIHAEIERDENAQAAMVLTRHYDSNRRLTTTTLLIQSPLISKALRDVVKRYPGIGMHGQHGIKIRGQPRCLFHHHRELKAYARASSVPDMVKHVDLCLSYMRRTLKEDIRAYENTMNSPACVPGLDFAQLWMAFKPGSLVFTRHGELRIDTVGELVNFIGQFDAETNSLISWKVQLRQIVANNGRFRYFDDGALDLVIKRYDGYKPLVSLTAFPLCFHEDEADLRVQLIARGRKTLQLNDIHHCTYDGKAVRLLPPDPAVALQSGLTEHRGDVIIDEREDSGSEYETIYQRYGSDEEGYSTPTDEECLIATGECRGFSLKSKKTFRLNAALVAERAYNEQAYESLVLPPDKKLMLKSIIEQRENNLPIFDDFINGKGKGLVIMLHGPPGVGKTFTAESIAEHTRRPLYRITVADLGSKPATVEQQLDLVFQRATRWNAIVLFDEADVFLCSRGTQAGSIDLSRNAIVAVFLRSMEYFEGILLLATNDLDVIDAAVRSRIHYFVQYHNLSELSRRQLWETFIGKAAGQQRPAWLNNAALTKCASRGLNGREIKNAVRMAHALAANEDRVIALADILKTLQALDVVKNRSTTLASEAKT